MNLIKKDERFARDEPRARDNEGDLPVDCIGIERSVENFLELRGLDEVDGHEALVIEVPKLGDYIRFSNLPSPLDEQALHTLARPPRPKRFEHLSL